MKILFKKSRAASWIINNRRCCRSPTKILEELGLKKLQESRSISKLKMPHGFYYGHKFMTPSLLTSKAQNANLHFKLMLDHMNVYDG